MRSFILCFLLLFVVPTVGASADCGDADGLEMTLRDLEQKQRIFAKPLLDVPMRQAWRREPEDAFMPGRVRLYAKSDGFVVLAALADASIGNTADGFNQKTWQLGDVFECFIQTGAERYYEIHVTPENRNLFLYWSPDTFRAVRAGDLPFENALIDDRTFARTQTWVEPTARVWAVSLFIPYSRLGGGRDMSHRNGKTDTTELRFAFARYDVETERASDPVLSATPALPEENFHLREYWHPVAWPVR